MEEYKDEYTVYDVCDDIISGDHGDAPRIRGAKRDFESQLHLARLSELFQNGAVVISLKRDL